MTLFQFNPNFKLVVDMRMQHKHGYKPDGSFEEYMYFERWCHYDIDVQILDGMCYESASDLAKDPRLSAFLKANWKILISPHSSEIGCEPTAFDCINTEVDIDELNNDTKVHGIKLTDDVPADLETPSVIKELKEHKYDAKKPLLVLPATYFVLLAETTIAELPVTKSPESDKKRKISDE